jgi:uncharacterized damage-inducible protein DinB
MTEIWLTGPVDGVDPLLMPVAHAFLQVRAELPRLLEGLSIDDIWRRPGASAAIGFHALHLAGATDRLLTYARGESLSESQLADARAEKAVDALDAAAIVRRVEAAVDAALAQIRATSAADLATPREVGRQRLPSTVLGLLFHAAEHATRHAGQIATLRRIVHSHT